VTGFEEGAITGVETRRGSDNTTDDDGTDDISGLAGWQVDVGGERGLLVGPTAVSGFESGAITGVETGAITCAAVGLESGDETGVESGDT
jgi:hypothetical protein